MYSAKMILTLNEIAHRYQQFIYQSIHSVLSQPPYRNTGAGAESLKVEVTEGDESKAPAIKITFDDHLIFLDKRRIEWTRMPDMQEMIAWAKTKRSNESEALQLAWATGFEKKKNDTWKAKQWRKKTLSSVLKEMNQLILTAFDEAIQADFDAAVKV